MKKIDENTKSKVLITLILMLPALALMSGHWIGTVLVIAYLAYFVYIVVDKDLLKLRLPTLCEDLGTKAEKKVKQEVNVFRQAENNVLKEFKVTPPPKKKNRK